MDHNKPEKGNLAGNGDVLGSRENVLLFFLSYSHLRERSYFMSKMRIALMKEKQLENKEEIMEIN